MTGEHVDPSRDADFLPYSRPIVSEADVVAVADAMRDPMISQGPRLKRLETSFARMTGATWAVGVSSGTAALHAACFAAGLGPGDEVIVPALTFAGTSNAILLTGATPVFADIDPETLCISIDEVERLLSEQTRAILSVDFAGHPAPYDELRGIADRHGLALLSDAAHAPGSEYRGRAVGGSTADITAFSLNPVKNITGGEGGIVTGNDPAVCDTVTRFRTHGMTRDARLLEEAAPADWYYEQQFLGLNYKLSELHAALALSQLDRLSAHNEARARLARHYHNELSDLPLRLPLAREDVRHAWHLYVVRVEGNDVSQRDGLFRSLHKRRIGAQLHYIPVPLHPHYRRMGFSMAGLAHTSEYFRTAMSLPLHPAMTEADCDRVVDVVRGFFRADA
jgi:dTDP-4-amino-4,6-dideoxygalactose transaminase